jgi:multiple antibiotic resistance protein
MMAGPGAIATTLLLTGNAADATRLAIVIAIILLVCLLCMLSFTFAGLISQSLGRTGNAVLSRLLGILLAAYAVQFVLNGITAVRTGLS